MLPEELVRALYAADAMQALSPKRSPCSLRPVWLALLITAPRVSALAALDVEDLDLEHSRLRFGDGVGNKNVGAGCVDTRTRAELQQYVGTRTEGPLFLSPGGKRLDKDNTLKDWRAVFSLAQVDLLWPDDVPREFRLGYLVHLSLLKGDTVFTLGGGRKPGKAKHLERDRRKAEVEELAERIEPQWNERTANVDVHAFRMTLRTWSIQEQVPEVFIDLQLGHASDRNKAALAAFWSMTGGKHYTDFDLLTGNAVRVADAMRAVMDRAKAEFLALPDGATFFARAQTQETDDDTSSAVSGSV
ncbi:hypothetical protein JYT15_00720 [Acidimicrobium ferrooxidans]|nr:hypothetical protein [Acidimicrobium ferrooxidans]